MNLAFNDWDENLFLALPFPVFILDAHFRLVSGNGAFGNFIGRDPGEYAGTPVSDYCPPDLRAFHLQKDAELLESGEQIYRADVVTPSTNNVNIRIWRRVFRDTGGEIERVIGAVLEEVLYRRSLRKLKDKLKKSKERVRELGLLVEQQNRLFTLIAHDLLGPMGNLRNGLELIATETAPDHENAAFLASLASSSRKVHQLLENLLLWSRTQAEELDCRKGTIDLERIVGETVSFLDHELREKSIELTMRLDEPKAYGDSTMVSTILRNLLSNSIRCTPTGGKITIKTSRDDTSVQILVKDNGRGMDRETLRRILKGEPSRHPRETRVHEREKAMASSSAAAAVGASASAAGLLATGNGLGLSFCREFVRKNNGKLSIKSHPEKGTIVRVSLPRTGIFSSVLKTDPGSSADPRPSASR